MDGMEVLTGDLEEVDQNDDSMMPLTADGSMAPHDEVSELEQEAVALANADIGNDEDDVNDDDVSHSPVQSLDGNSVSRSNAVITGQAIVGTASEQVIGLLLHTTTAGRVTMAPGVKLSVTSMLSDGSVDTTAGVQTIQAVTLTDGTTALIHQPKDGKLLEGQTVTLEDGSTAIVQGTLSPKCQLLQCCVEPLDDKVLEGQTIQLEDGTTAYLQPTSKAALSEGLQAIQLQDGTMAYITHPSHEALFGEAGGALDAATLDSLSSQLNGDGNKQHMTVEKALAIGEKAYKCGYSECGRLYTTLHHLKVHERSHTGDRPFRCEYPTCGKAFATGYGLKSHTRVHTGEKPYPCPEEGCDKAFKTSGDLQKHVRTHTGERPFKCPFEGCNRSFTTSNIRKVHIRTHTGERPYICQAEGCGRAFASATNYKNHVRIHTGEKPYVCTVQGCGKRFTEYSSLYKHHVVHTHSKPYICNHCGKTYRQTSTLAMHKRTAHGEDCTAESEAQLFAQQHDVEEENGEPNGKRQRLHFTLGDGSRSVGDEEGESSLVISTVQAEQMIGTKGNDGLVTDLATDVRTAGLVTLPAQVTLQALQAQGLTSITVGEHGQQVLVVTDPAQLEVLQQLAQQHLESAESLEAVVSSDGMVSHSSTITSVTSPVSTDTQMIVFPSE